MATATAERRTQHRVPMHVDVSYGAGGEFISASSCDLSATGMGLLGPKLYPVGTELDIRFRAPREGTGNLLFLRGVVKHAIGSRMGIHFSRMTPTQEAELRQAIFTLASP
jgi:c-di-GMP-binding flagellar brake protein YcgR